MNKCPHRRQSVKIVGKLGLLSSKSVEMSGERFPCLAKILTSYTEASGTRHSKSFKPFYEDDSELLGVGL